MALELDFVPVGYERYDLVIPRAFLDLPMIQHVLSLLHDDEFRAAVAAQPGYEITEMGRTVSL